MDKQGHSPETTCLEQDQGKHGPSLRSRAMNVSFVILLDHRVILESARAGRVFSIHAQQDWGIEQWEGHMRASSFAILAGMVSKGQFQPCIHFWEERESHDQGHPKGLHFIFSPFFLLHLFSAFLFLVYFVCL